MALFRVEFQGGKELIARLDAMPERVREALLVKVTSLTAQLHAKVFDKLSDDVLHVRTGELRRSINSDVQSSGNFVEGIVYSSVNSPANKYAAIQEYGGTVHIPEITPVKASVLHFLVGGKDVFAMRVRAHDVTIPARSYMRTALAEMEPAILTGISEAVTKALNE